MKKLKIILQSKLLILILIGITTIITIFNLNKKYFDVNRIGEDKIISGIVTSISYTTHNQVLEIKDTIIYTAMEEEYLLGQTIECSGITLLPSENTNFYLFNYRNYLKSKRIFYQINAECKVLNRDISILYKIKNMIIYRIDKLKSRGYLNAFFLGNTNNINENILNSYRNNGISHILAISGMHVTFLIGLFSFIKRKYLLLPVLLLYLFLASFPISMIRAVIFYIIIYINKKVKLNISKLILFVYFTIIILFWNPYLIYNIGFLYSFTIAFYLFLFSEKLKTSKNKIINIFLIPTLIFLITIPLNINTNFYINPLTIIYNIIFVPFISLILFPMSFLVFLFPILDNGYCFFWNIVENGSLFISNNLSFKFVLCHVSIYAFVGYYIIITIVMNKLLIKEYKYIGVLFLVLLCHHFYPYFRNYGIIQMLDIGQGDSIIISYPNNKLNILVDTGGDILKKTSNIANNVTIPSLYSLGISKLDYLILSHGDSDHAGEAINILENINVKMVVFNSGNISELENDIIEYLKSHKINYRFVSKEIVKYKDLELYFINSTDKQDENEDSLVLLFKIKNYTSLFMGDSGKKVEKELLKEYNLSDVDILKVGHHGSKNSTSEDFINYIKPNIALISAGRNNIYNHPHEEVLLNLQLCDTYITSTHGAIRLKIGNRVLVTTVR